METYDFIVIGAGAAGLMAAGRAAERGFSTLVVEKKDRPGRKLRITGKGRCNISNTAPLQDFISHFGKNGRFLRQAFAHFFTPELCALLEKLGVMTKIERGGRIFPSSDNAEDIVEALVAWNKAQGVTFKLHTTVTGITTQEDRITAITTNDGVTIQGGAILLATGGASYPVTGSTADGHQWLEQVGHTIIPLVPALVPLETGGNLAQRLQGLSLKNVSVTVWAGPKKLISVFGEMLFTHFGVSGPIILTLSKQIIARLAEKEDVEITIDLKPALDDPALDARLQRDFREQGKKQFKTILKHLLPASLIPICCEQTSIDGEKLVHQITAQERKKLRIWLKNFRLTITGHRPISEAIVTAGGVHLKEIDPRSMRSLIIKNLYCAGEILDLDADTGGFNLQAAFSTGWLAGNSIEKNS